METDRSKLMKQFGWTPSESGWKMEASLYIKKIEDLEERKLGRPLKNSMDEWWIKVNK